MKKPFTLFIALLISGLSFAQTQVTVTGCTGAGNGTYATLNAAATAIVVAQPSANIVITISGNTTEPAAGASLVAGTWTSLSIQPSGGAWTISGAITAGNPLLTLNGSDNVTINGLNSGGNSLTFSNTTNSNSSGTSTIKFITDATNNTITNCTILGSASMTVGTNGGNIWFSAGASTTGNDNNTISNCNIGPAGTNLPTKGIYMSGTTTSTNLYNSGNTFNNNNIYDYFGAAVASAGIYVSTGNTDNNITNNRFYQTAARTQTSSASQHSAIWIANTSGNNFLISGNIIGRAVYTSASGASSTGTTVTVASTDGLAVGMLVAVSAGTGIFAANTYVTAINSATSFTVSATPTVDLSGATVTGNSTTSIANYPATAYSFVGINSSVFYPVYLSVGGTTATSVQGNTFAGIAISGAMYGSLASSPFIIIDVAGGLTTIGNVTGNTIGSMSTTGSITYTSTYTSSSSNVIGMYNSSTNNWTTSNNNIGGITVSNATTGATLLYGIFCNTGNSYSWTCNGNTIGGNVSNSMDNTSTATASQIFGINVSGTVTTCTGNIVRNMRIAGGTGTTSSASIIGIHINGPSTNHTVQQNMVYSLTNSNTGATAVNVIGIRFASSTGTNLIARNFVYNLSAATSVASTIYGIAATAGTATYQNNMISLGNDATGAAITGSHLFNGINASAGTNNFYNNSVYIGGAGVTGASATYAFYNLSTSTRSIRDNIFVNARSNGSGTGSHYAIYETSTTGLTINYNDYFANGTGGVLGNFNATPKTTLLAWQGATTQDANSFSSDPLFNNASAATPNIHLTAGSPCEGIGVAIGTVTDDFDGDLRSGFTPTDIGADAGLYSPLGIDMKPVALVAPAVGGCFTSAMAVTVTIQNNSGSVIDFSVNPVSVSVTETTAGTAYAGSNTVNTGTLAAGATQDVTMTTTISMLANGTYTFNASVSVAGDVNTANDVLAPVVRSLNQLSGAYTVGTGGNYATLTTAGGLFEAINNFGLKGNVTVNIISNITETGAIALNQWTESCAGNYSLTIQSNGSAWVLKGVTTQPGMLIPLNGADRVTIDGGTGKLLTFRTYNGTPYSTGSVFGFYGGSTGCTVNNCFIESNSTYISLGLVTIGTGINNVTISNSNIKNETDQWGGSPNIGIYSNTNTNTLNITGNNIYNWKYSSGTSYGIDLASVADGCVISGNSFFMESGISPVNAQTAIYVGAGNNHTISGNYIGGQSASCGGSAWTNSGAVTFTGIQVQGSTTTANTIQGNVIQNISMTNSGSYYFYGIYVSAASYNNFTGNTIGHATTDGSITIAGTGWVQPVYFYYGNLNNCLIANIKQTATNPGNFYGIYFLPTGIVSNITNNRIYNVGATSASTGTNEVTGIYSPGSAGGTALWTIANNMISLGDGITNNNIYKGIDDFGSTGNNFRIYHNTIRIGGTANGSSNTYAYLKHDAPNETHNNNLYVNLRTGSTGKHYAIGITNVTGTIVSNYNDLYVAGSNLGIWSSTIAADLAAWRTASSKDANSISVAPVFISSTDLHLNTTLNSSINNLGTPIAAVTTDIDGNARDLSTPDMGADEFDAILCTGAVGGTAAGTASFCGPGTPTITATGYSIGIGSTYQWMSSSVIGDYPSGGTPVSSQTNPASLTTGVVSTTTYYWLKVTCTSGTATDYSNMITVAVNPVPAKPSNPISNSPNCINVTLTQNGTAPAGETWYWQTSASGIIVNTGVNDQTTYVVATSGTYYIRSQDNSSLCWSAGAGSLAVIVNQLPAAATTPSPSNAATNVCYAGTSPVTSVTWAAVSGATSYDVYFGAGSLPGAVTSNVATNSYSTGTLASGTTYYWKVVPKNGCGDAIGASTWTFTTLNTPCYCSSTATGSTIYISAFSTTGGTTNITNNSGAWSSNGYGNFTAQSISNSPGLTVNYSFAISGITGGVGVAIFVDWNQNGSFTDAGENVYNSTAYLYANPSGSFIVPTGALIGSTRMRIVANYNSTTPVSCNTNITGETEDYTFIVNPLIVPTLTTTDITAITQNTASSGGNISSDGGYNVTERGIVYSTSSGVNTSNGTKVIDGSTGTGTFTSELSGLQDNKTYYVKAYAFNINGTSYGSERSFITLPVDIPVATAANPVNSTDFTANWNTSAGATSYRLDVATTNTFGSTQTIVSDGFENSSTFFTVSGGTYYSGSSASGDRPASSPFYSGGAFAYGRSNGTATLTSSNINTSAYTSIDMLFRLASISVNSAANGADGGDIVTVEISPDGGTNYYSTIRVLGNTNACWAYSATGIASTTYDGNSTPVDFAPAGGALRTTDGYSTITVTGLPSSNNLKIRISMLNNDANERWLIDDFLLTGFVSSCIPGYENLVVNGTSQLVNGLIPSPNYYYRVRGVGSNSTSGNSNIITVSPDCTTAVGGTATGTASYCGPATPSITASGYSYGNGSTYQWQNSNDNFSGDIHDFSGQTNPAVLTTGVVSATTYYRLKVTCPSGTATDYSTIVIITIKANPTATASSNIPVCQGSTLQLTGTTDIGNNYTWTGPNGFASSSQSPSITSVSPAAAGTYSFTASLDGCSSTSTVAVTVNPSPSAVTVTPATATMCGSAIQALVASGGLGAVTNASGYIFTAANGTFTPVTGGTTITGGNADDYFSGALPIGFTFNYEGTNYTNFYFSSNGFIAFTSSIGTSASNVLGTASSPVLAPLWDDLDGATAGAASYLTTGTVGNRILTVQWLNWEWYYSANAAVISFQVKIYEADGHIEFVYRQEANAATSGSASIGISGATAGKYLSLNGVGTSPTASSITVTSNLSITRPATGQTYTFSKASYPITWTSPSNTDIYSNSGATTPYVTGTAATNVWVKPTATAIYTATATGTNGCTSTGTSAITINSSSVAPTGIAGTTSICSGSSTTLTAIGGIEGSGSTTNWFEGSCESTFTQEWFTQPYATVATTVNSMNGGILDITSTNVAPEIDMYSIGSFDPALYKYIQIRYKVVSGGPAGNMSIYYTNTLHATPDPSQVVNGVINNDGDWHIMNLDMSTSGLWSNSNITGWRFDWCSAWGANLQIDYISLGAGMAVEQGNSITVSPVAETNYYVSRRGTCNTTGCINTTVTISPEVSTPVFNLSSTSTRCSGAGTVTYTAIATATTGIAYTLDAESLLAGNTIDAATGVVTYTSAWFGTSIITASAAGCGGPKTAAHTVTINETPSMVTVTPSSASICSSNIQTLVASGGTVSSGSTTILDENFNGYGDPAGWTKYNTSTNAPLGAWTLESNGYNWAPQGATFQSNDNSQFYLSNIDATGGGTNSVMLVSPAFSTVGYTAASVSFYHYFYADNQFTGTLDYSMDGGYTWVNMKTYVNNIGAPNSFVQDVATLPAGQPSVKVRFDLEGDYGYFWAIDNVKVTGASSNAPITWTPVTGLYTDPGASAAYILNTPARTVYAHPTVSTVYTATAMATNGCMTEVTSSITVNTLSTATISYSGSPYCKTVISAPVTLNGTGAYTGGTYSADAGLSIDAFGNIDPSASAAGIYTVTYSLPSYGGCGEVITSTDVTITEVPTATISYSGTPYCTSVNSAPVTLNVTGAYTGGTYSADAGLSFDAFGTINPSASSAGIYTVTYTIAAHSGCGEVQATTDVTITALPVATFSYTGSPYLSTGTALPTLDGVSGVFSATPAGLVINTATGEVDLSASIAGTYDVTNTIAAAGGCAEVTATSSITIFPMEHHFTLKVFIEGLYVGGGMMHEALDFNPVTEDFPMKWGAGIADTVTVAFYDDTYSNLIALYHGVFLNTDGSISIPLSSLMTGSYYITIFARNSVPITTATPQSFAGSSISYDFTDAVEKAYGIDAGGVPQKDLGDGYFGMYSGELDHDAYFAIDGSDVTVLDPDILVGPYGYRDTDLNGDGVVDGSDMSVMDANLLFGPLFWNPTIAKKKAIILNQINHQ